MYIKDLISSSSEVVEDSWAKKHEYFGVDNHLKVVGVIKNLGTPRNKYCIVECSVCAKDEELHGTGHFKVLKSSLVHGSLPCACSGHYCWNEQQYATLCTREANKCGYKFSEWSTEYKTPKSTKLSLSCKDHGLWETTSIQNFIHNGRGCPECGKKSGKLVSLSRRIEQIQALCMDTPHTFISVLGDFMGAFTRVEMSCELHGAWEATIHSICNKKSFCFECSVDKRAKNKTLSKEIMVAKFMKSGAFHPQTSFKKVGSRNGKALWSVLCPECGGSGESTLDNLQQGKRPCMCSKANRQLEAYIHLVKDNDITIALKFGVSRNSSSRRKTQDYYCIFDVKPHSVYTFPSVKSCRSAERECKHTLLCGIVSKDEMSDGYTETTSPFNIDKIIEIYKKYGGELMEHNNP